MKEKKRRKTIQEFYSRIHMDSEGEVHMTNRPVRATEYDNGHNHAERRS